MVQVQSLAPELSLASGMAKKTKNEKQVSTMFLNVSVSLSLTKGLLQRSAWASEANDL